MAMKHSVAIANAKLDAYETVIGTSPILRIRTGSPPANIAASATGTVLAELTLPSDWMAAASGGTKAKSGTWQDLSADDDGVAGHFEIVRSDGTTRELQGVVTAVGGGGDMEIDNTSIASGQQVTVASFSINGNANVT